jgi:hypothetical protein
MNKNSKTKSNNIDLRKKLRIDTVQKVKFRTNASKTNSLTHGQGFSQNLSENGCCLFLDREIPEGSLIEITFERLGNNNHDVKIIGRVIWQKDFLSGVKFLCNA